MSKNADLAYREIRSMILQGKFAPGERLPERILVEALNVSRTPVREALRRLNAEGLVVFEPHCGARVPSLDPREVEDLYELSVTIESLAAGLAAKRATAAHVRALERVLTQLEAAVERAEADLLECYTALDLQFHDLIIQATSNARLGTVLRQIVTRPTLVAVFLHYSPQQFQRSCSQHREIFEAIVSGDENWAAAAMRNHILAGKHQMDRAGAPQAIVESD